MAFDVYGTLGDPARLTDANTGAPPELAASWRRHQLEITWLLTVMDRYEDFDAVTAHALDVAVAEAGLGLSPADRATLLEGARALAPFPDAAAALERLDAAGLPLVVLSNGSPSGLETLLASAGLRERFVEVISAGEVGAYKPSPRVYKHAAERLGRPPGEIWLVSGNPFDAAGAKLAGMRVVKVERGASFRYPFAPAPDLVVEDLAGLRAEPLTRRTPAEW